MDVLILAAGRGERLRPLTDMVPKPLLEAGGRSLIEHLITALAAAGYRRLVVNHAHLGQQLKDRLGDGQRYGVSIRYSDESTGALETGGGIHHALPLLGSNPFAVVNGDLWTNFPFARLPDSIDGMAHLVLVDNPAHNSKGDFYLTGNRVVETDKVSDTRRLTFSGIGVYRKELFVDCKPGAFPLAPILRDAIAAGRVSGEYYKGEWEDIGTPQRLAELDRRLANQK